jgi:hypothetical protein
MYRSGKNRITKSAAGGSRGRRLVRQVLVLLLATGASVLSGCGGSESNKIVLDLSGNWQFTMSPQIDQNNQTEFLGGLNGGFLLESGGAVKGGTQYAVYPPGLPYACNSGSATITGSITGQTVTLTAVAGTQTFTLTGNLDYDNSTMSGTYTSTAGTAPDGSACGIATSDVQWSAVLVPTIGGSIEGSFHSTGGGSGLTNQDFLLSGSIVEAENTGAASAVVSGNISFVPADQTSSDYPCIANASLYGSISGNSVSFEIVGANESIIGEIGEPLSSNGGSGLNPVILESANGGYILHAAIGPSYLVATNSCQGGTDSISTAGDYGGVCIAVNGIGAENACQQPITVTPDPLIFGALLAGTTYTTGTITLANTSGGSLNGLTLAFANVPASDTTYSESDTCGNGGVQSEPDEPFNLSSGASCAITITFQPACGNECSSPMNAALTVTSPVSADNDTIFTVPITSNGAKSNTAKLREKNFSGH